MDKKANTSISLVCSINNNGKKKRTERFVWSNKYHMGCGRMFFSERSNHKRLSIMIVIEYRNLRRRRTFRWADDEIFIVATIG